MNEGKSVKPIYLDKEVCTEEKSSAAIRPRDRELFFAADKWARFPVLPLIRKDGVNKRPELGFVLHGNVTKVYCGNMFADIKSLKTVEYPSVDALLNDGWRVN